MNNNAEYRLNQIANYVIDYFQEHKFEPDQSLYTGRAGILMFYAYYYRYTGGEYRQVVDELLESCCEHICHGEYEVSLGQGVTGILYGLDHLCENGLIDIDLTEVKNHYSGYIASHLNNYSADGKYDLIYEGTGIALYLLRFGRQSDLDHVAEYIRQLSNNAERKNDSVRWTTDMNPEHRKVYSVALSHGMSSIAIFLARCVEKKIEIRLSTELLTGAINYILGQELNHLEYGSYFPYNSLDEPSKSRMAWCYGDLGVAMALWKAGVVLNKTQWISKAIEVLEFASARRNLQSEMVFNAGLCHGAAGIAHIFRRMYYNTGNDLLLSANNYWIDEALKMIERNDGSGASSMSSDDNTTEWANGYGLLKGMAGIGLALLASQGDERYSSWDELILLS